MIKPILFSLAILSISLLSAMSDTTLYDSQDFVIVKNSTDQTYSLTIKKVNKKLDQLKYANMIYQSAQIVDKDNKLYYVDSEGVISSEVDDFLGLCGTVPHYDMTIKKTGGFYEVWRDETFYDANNQEPAELIYKISTKDADNVFLVNGKKKFNYSANFSYNFTPTNPNTIIIKKEGKYYSASQPDEKYDSIDFSDYQNLLKSKKGDLYGIVGIVSPKYLEIGSYNYNLAKVKKTDNTIAYIDLDGVEY